MNKRPYYSARTTGAPEGTKIGLPEFRKLFVGLYRNFKDRGYLEETFGYRDAYGNSVPGLAGGRPADYVFARLRKQGLWPPKDRAEHAEEDVFDMIEFMFDQVSKPLQQRAGSGLLTEVAEAVIRLPRAYDRGAGRQEFSAEVNVFLREYGSGWELSEDGRILSLPAEGLQELVRAELPSADEKNVRSRVKEAVRKFHLRGATLSEKKDAVRDLGDVLEFLRGDAKRLLNSKDEGDLFQILNSFGIRHHRADQRTEYDLEILLPALFYHYLNMIHLVLRLKAREDE